MERMESAPMLCKQGVAGSIPATSTIPLGRSFLQLRLLSRPPILRGFAWSNLEQQSSFHVLECPRFRPSVEELREISWDSTDPG
jgi:hypothetical protein